MIALYAESNSFKDAILNYNFQLTTINDWIKNKTKYLSQKNIKIKKSNYAKGKPPLNSQLKSELLKIIIEVKLL